MTKYMVMHLIKLESVGLSPQIVSEQFKNIKDAEKARLGYMDLYPSINPQNIQIIQYAD